MSPDLNGQPFLNPKNARTIGWHGLFCIDCEVHGISISPSRGGRGTNDLTSYVAECHQCKARTDHLGGDGTIRKAVAEWKQICRAALRVKKQLLGETAMNEQLELNVTAFLGVTDWIDAATSPPTLSGWYDARVKMSEEEREERQPYHQRRWWNAGTQTFSMPVTVGEEYTGGEMMLMSTKHSTRDLSTLEYRGLKEQHPKLTLLRRG